jgi:hypothetical protein
MNHSLPEVIADIVVKNITNKLTVNGVVPLTPSMLDARMKDLEMVLKGWFEAEALARVPASTLATTTPGVAGSCPTNDWWRTWDWKDGEAVHYVPRDWRWPRTLPFKQMWDLWYFGNRDLGIRPFGQINKDHDLCKEDRQSVYSTCRLVIQRMEQIIEECDTITLPEGVRTVGQLPISCSDSAAAV